MEKDLSTEASEEIDKKAIALESSKCDMNEHQTRIGLYVSFLISAAPKLTLKF